MTLENMIPIAVVLVIIILIILGKYNKMVKLKNKVNLAKSNIDVYLNQRFDLIPNLVECVKGYMKYEKDTLENITNLRTKYLQSNKNDLKTAKIINDSINKIIAVGEDYPELKASEQFLNLQKSLSKMESQLQAARRIYNMEVTEYNTKINVIPNNIIAKIFGFKQEDLFEIEEYKKENINVNLEG